MIRELSSFSRAVLLVLSCAACGASRGAPAPAPDAGARTLDAERTEARQATEGARLAQEARAAALQPAARRFEGSSRSTLSLAGEVWSARASVLVSEVGFRARGEVRAPSGETRDVELGRADGGWVFVDHTARTCTAGGAADLGGAWSEELAGLASVLEALPADGAGCRASGVEEFAGEQCRVLRLAGAGGERAWWIDSRALVRRSSERRALERAETRVATVTLERWGAPEPGASLAVELPAGYERLAPRSTRAREPAAAARAPLALDASLAPLRSAFERARDRLRLVAFFAPTCTSCLRVARALDSEVLERFPDTPLAVLIVWIDVLASDGVPGALRASTVFDDARVEQFHDSARHAGRAFAPHVGMPAASAVASGAEWQRAFQPDFVHGAPAVYDSVLFFPAGVGWSAPAPLPSAWVTQLDPELWRGIDPAHFRYGEALRAELARLVEELSAR